MNNLNSRVPLAAQSFTHALVMLLITVALPTNLVVADGILRDGVGAISTGRGCTNVGFSDNGNIILDNPGALVNVDGAGLVEADFDVFFPDFSYRDPDNAWVKASNDPFPMGQLSIIRKSQDEIFAWGLGAFSHAGFSTRYEMNGPFPLSGPQIYKSVGGLMRILPSLSVALTDRWSVGGTLGAAVSHTELEGPYFTQYPTPVQGTPTLMDLQASGAGLSWSVGTQYRLTEQTVLGASFQGSTRIKADGSAKLFVPTLGNSEFDLDLETQWPSILAIGFSHSVTTKTQIATDVIWTDWSAAKDNYNMLLSNPTNPVFLSILGSSLPETFPLKWRDSVAVRMGVQHSISESRIIRAGYVAHPNVIPASTLSPFIQAIVEHSLSCGYGWRVGDYGVDAGYQYMFGPNQEVGASGFIGGDFDGSTSSVSAHWLLASIIRHF